MSVYGFTYPQLRQADPLVGDELIAVWQTGQLKRCTVTDVASTGVIVMGQLYFASPANTGANPLPLISYAEYPGEFISLGGLVVGSGSLMLTIAINGTPITGLSGISVTTVPQNITASAANDFAIGDRVTMELSSVSASRFEFSTSIQRLG